MKYDAWGIASAFGAYGIWGFLPIYWKLLQEVPALEIFAQRVIWSFVFLSLGLWLARRLRLFNQETRAIIAHPGKLLGLIGASIIITLSGLLYIWAVNDNRIVETSLGYYINPLVSVLFAVVILNERLSFWLTVSVILAAAGVINLTVSFGAVPWVALGLAFSFGLYGLCKKLLNIGAITSITLESLIILPLALIYLSYIHHEGAGAFGSSSGVTGLLIGSGIVYAIPMILFTNGAIRLPLSVLGLIQYISPTVALLVGVFMYQEPFSSTHLISFCLIWLALGIFSLSGTRPFLHLEAIVQRKLPFNSE